MEATVNETKGPIEDGNWPTKLQARVVEPGPHPRVQGFDVHGDLGVHYRFTDIVLLALTSDLDEKAGAALDTAMAFACPIDVADAPSHAAVVARLCGSRTSGIVAVAATTVAEQSRALIDEHEMLLPRLAIGSLNGMAAKFAARSETERESVASLRRALGAFVSRVPSLGYDLRLDTAIIAVLFACGLRTRDKLELAFTLARLPIACAEAFAAPVGAFGGYPMNTPTFDYEVKS